MAMCSTNLTDLPEEVLDEIASHLGCKDLVNLASAHPKLRFLRPRVQTIDLTGDVFSWGPVDVEHDNWQGADAPILARGLIAVNTSYFYGHLWLRLIRNGFEIEESSHDWPGQGRNFSTKKTIEVANHPVGTRAKKGDTLRIERTLILERETVPDDWDRFIVTLVYKR